MTDHSWFLENVASYLADGLDPAEAERFEEHAALCTACAQALAEARALDRTIDSLFVGARPRPELEDQTIRALRLRGNRSPRPLFLRLAIGAAAVVALGAVGLAGNRLIETGELVFPGAAQEGRMLAKNELKQLEQLPHIYAPVDFDGRVAGGERDIASQRKPSAPEEVRKIPENKPASGEADKSAKSSATVTFSDGSVNSLRDSLDLSRLSVLATGGDGKELPSFEERSRKGKDQPARENYYSYTNAQPAPSPSSPSFAPPTYRTGTATGDYAASAGRPAAGVHFRPEAMNQTNPPGCSIVGAQIEEDRQSGIKDDKSNKIKDSLTQDKEKEKVAAPPEAQKPMPAQNPPQAPASPRKIVIRSGEMEFEVESFDAAVAVVTKLADAIQGGFVATINSDKLANGKMRGSIVVRVPPDRLDGLVADLLKELGKSGELKNRRIGSQDITKQYTDLESRLRAARTMEDRLLSIIKNGKGEIKDLLNAEKELGVWRTKIEEFEGELRYYGNLVSLSTLTITLTERAIRAPFEISETERINMSIEVEDVEKAQKAALAAVTAAKGRITKSELKQHGAGQTSAVLEFAVAPEAAATVRDRLKELGQVVVFDVDRLQQAQGGSGPAPGAKLKRNDTHFAVNVYNLATVAPRETVYVHLASADAEAAYRDILDRVRKASGRVVTSNLNRQRDDQTKGVIDGEMRTAEADAFLQAVKDLGEVMLLQIIENPDSQNVTRSKRGFKIEVYALGAVPPRETALIQLAARDVPTGYRDLRKAVAKAKGRILLAQLHEQNKQNVTAVFKFEVRREEEAAILAALSAIGDVVSRNVTRAQEGQNAIDSKVRYEVNFMDLTHVPPRETVTLGLEVADVDRTAAAFTAYVAEVKGRVTQSQMTRQPNGQITSRLAFDVPLHAAPALVEKFKTAGTVRTQEASRNPQVPESELAVARIDVTLSNTELIVPSDQGIWPQIRKGLSTSFVAISWSLTVVIIGVCFILPWAVALYVGYLIAQRLRRKPASSTPSV